MKRLDQIAAVVLLLSSLYYTYEASRMPFMTGKAPGSGWLPLFLGALMALLSTLLLVSGVRRPASGDKKVDWPAGRGLTNNVVIVGGLVASVLLLPWAGYIVSTFVFLFGLTMFLGRYSWARSGIISAIASGVLYGVFKVWLAIPLPAGFMGGL